VAGEKFVITEWDGEKDVVTVLGATRENVTMEYLDGVVHVVPVTHFCELMPTWVSTQSCGTLS